MTRDKKKDVNFKKGKNKKIARKRRVRFVIVIVVFLLLVAIVAGGGYGYYKHASKAVDPNDKSSIVVSIPEGSSVKTMAKILKEKGLIRNKSVFVSNAKETNQTDKMKSGKYKFSKSMDNQTIIDMMIKGKVYQDGIKVTIPEGSVSTDIVDTLVKKGLGSRDKYVKLFRNPEKFSKKFTFLNDKRIATLEGFLYPETYFFKKSATEEEIFTKMISEFEKKYVKNAQKYVEKNKLNFYDTIIMASIVEKEAVKDVDRPIIAGVFYNRLEKKMRLQSDAVLQYGLPNRKSRVLFSDLKVESPYNLYLNDGLPPTPIASPGIESIKAAANPKKTEYLYFVTNKDGTNSYSKTFDEHKVNADKYRKEMYGSSSSESSNSDRSSEDKKNTDNSN